MHAGRAGAAHDRLGRPVRRRRAQPARQHQHDHAHDGFTLRRPDQLPLSPQRGQRRRQPRRPRQQPQRQLAASRGRADDAAVLALHARRGGARCWPRCSWRRARRSCWPATNWATASRATTTPTARTTRSAGSTGPMPTTSLIAFGALAALRSHTPRSAIRGGSGPPLPRAGPPVRAGRRHRVAAPGRRRDVGTQDWDDPWDAQLRLRDRGRRRRAPAHRARDGADAPGALDAGVRAAGGRVARGCSTRSAPSPAARGTSGGRYELAGPRVVLSWCRRSRLTQPDAIAVRTCAQRRAAAPHLAARPAWLRRLRRRGLSLRRLARRPPGRRCGRCCRSAGVGAGQLALHERLGLRRQPAAGGPGASCSGAGWLAATDSRRRTALERSASRLRARCVPFRMAAPGAWRRSAFAAQAARDERRRAARAFREQQPHWLDDYALFMALHERHGGRDWCDWPAELGRARRGGARSAAREAARRTHRLLELRANGASSASGTGCARHAHERGVQIVGDVPIFVAHHSADVWAQPGAVRAGLRRAGPPWSPACRPTTSAPPASAGATRCTAGTRMRSRWLRLVDARACGASVELRRHRAHRPLPRLRRLLGDPGQRAARRSTAAGAPGRAARSVRGRRTPRSGRCRSSPRTWA